MTASQNYTCCACGNQINKGKNFLIRDGFLTHSDCAEILDLMVSENENKQYADFMEI